MTLPRTLRWIGGIVLASLVIAVLFVAIAGWNWLRGPIERMAMEKTGRELVIHGDLTLKIGWPSPQIHAGAVSFSNPAWAAEKQMIAADAVEVSIDLPQLLRKNLVLSDVRLERPVIYLEQGSGGRKNWLLDREQRDEGARIHVDRLTLDRGTLGYDNAEQKTSIRAQLSSTGNTEPSDADLSFTAAGKYKGLPLLASGSGGPVLGLRDENAPYRLKARIAVGHTEADVDGTITSLLKFSAVDVRLALRGDSLAQLFPLIGIVFPETRAYTTQGHMVHSGQSWHYEKFSGRIGSSDIAGEFQAETGGKRPAIRADVVSRRLDFADLGALIGARPGGVQAAKKAAAASPPTAARTPTPARVLPDVPFRTERWDSIDAEVTLKAAAIRGAKDLRVDDLSTHLSLRDSVLTLDPLSFAVAGGEIAGTVSLDGSENPIQANARLRVKKILISKLFPALATGQPSLGQINGEFHLAGNGNSVGGMLANADGKVRLVATGGKISRLMMEKAGLHLWEILELKMSGDQLVQLRCGVADFSVKDGTMRAEALTFDTTVTTITGSGSIDLREEKLDLTLIPNTKNTSLVALRSPLHVRGSFARPEIDVDRGRVAARAFGAVALAVVNPLLALIPLVDAGPGSDSDCGQAARHAKPLPPSAQRSGPSKYAAD